MNDYFVSNEAGRDYVLGMQALKPIALPSDIGEVASFSPRLPPAGSPTIRSTRGGLKLWRQRVKPSHAKPTNTRLRIRESEHP